MDDLIRARIHQALDVEPPPTDLRHSAIWAVAMPERLKQRRRGLRLEWAGGLIAALLAVAVIAGLMYSGGLFKSHFNSGPRPASPRFLSPEGIAIGSDGTPYVSDFVTGFVFRVRADGALVPFAGGGTSKEGQPLQIRLEHPLALAIDRDGYMYIAEAYGGPGETSWPGDILRVEPRGVVLVFAQVGAVHNPVGLAVDSVGNVYFSAFGGNVGSLDRSGGVNWTDVPRVAGPVPNPGYMVFDSHGDLFFSDRAPNFAGGPGGCRIVRVTPDHTFSVVAGTGVCGFSGDGGPATQAQLDDPNGIAFDSHGNLYFADSNNHRIRRIDPNGVITTVAGTGETGFHGDGGSARSAQLSFPFGIGMAAGDLLYIADASCPCEKPSVPGRIRLVDLQSGIISSVVTGATPIASPGG
jgi:sugar lactone lactonase YvrE